MWTHREQLLGLMGYIESMIWGKPLDKDMWTSEEWKNRKRAKFVWKKKKEPIQEVEE